MKSAVDVDHCTFLGRLPIVDAVNVHFYCCFHHAHSLTQKTWEKSPNNIEIRPNLTYSVSRDLETGLVVPKLCTTGLETGCKPVLLI